MATTSAISGPDQQGHEHRRQPGHVRAVDRDRHDQPDQERGRRGERKAEDDADDECPDAIERAEDQLAADEPGRCRSDAAPEHERVFAPVGRREVESEPEDAVAVDRHEHGEAQHDDRIDEGPDRGQRTAQGRDREPGCPGEDAGQCRMERPGHVDRDALLIEPVLDVLQEARWVGREGRQCRGKLRERVAQRGEDPHDDHRPDQDDRDDHRDHGDRAGKSCQAPLEEVGDRGDEERQQPGEEEDEDQPEVVLKVPCQEPEDHEGDGQGREDDQYLDPSGSTLQHVSQTARRPAVARHCRHIG